MALATPAFAAGDPTNNGASIAIDAIAEANIAARAINAYLLGMPMDFPKPYYSERKVTAEMLADREKKARAVMSVKAPEYRRNNFDEILNGFTDEQAREEAKRCLECGCHDFKECKLIRYANDEPIAPERLAGEILDVDGLTGGFNLQIAFSTGYLAGKSAAEI